MPFLDYAIPILAFLLLILTSWESIAKNRKITSRGLAIMITGALTLFLGVREYLQQQSESRALVDRIALEARRLHPQDFTFRITATHGPPGRPASEVPSGRDDASESLLLYAVIGNDAQPAYIQGVWTLLKKPPPELPSSRNPYETFEYVGREVVISGLEAFPYIDSLAGKVVRVYVPRRLIEFGRLTWSYKLDMVVRGRKLTGELVESNVVEIRIPTGFPNV